MKEGYEGMGEWKRKLLNKSFEILFNTGLSGQQAKGPSLPRRWQTKGSLGKGVGGPLLKKFHPPPHGNCP